MKIAIYGDSFGSSMIDSLLEEKDCDTRGNAWVEHLSEIHEVTNYSYPGSSLFYNYKLFLENNQNFDYNIFLITEPNRITLPDNPILITDDNKPGLTKHINLGIVDSFDRFLNSDNDTHNLNLIISALKSYYSFIHNQEAVDTFHNLMIDNIKKINRNTITIPCFTFSIPNTEISLNCISNYELSNFEIVEFLREKEYFLWTPIEDVTGKWTYSDYRKCHLNEENHKKLFDLINDAIINKQQTINLDLNQFVKASKDVEYYYFYVDLNQLWFERRLNGELHNLYNKLLIDTN